MYKIFVIIFVVLLIYCVPIETHYFHSLNMSIDGLNYCFIDILLSVLITIKKNQSIILPANIFSVNIILAIAIFSWSDIQTEIIILFSFWGFYSSVFYLLVCPVSWLNQRNCSLKLLRFVYYLNWSFMKIQILIMQLFGGSSK